jgi:beta-carotene ketolase (CrtO type)
VSEERYDVIVIGAGHNGLTAAAFLARAGRRVLVVEALERLGGFCTTDAYIPDAENFRFSPHAMDHVLMAVEPSVATELELVRFGLDYFEIDPFGGWIDRDGQSIVLWRDLDRTVAALAKISPADAAAYKTLIEQGRALWSVALPYLMDHPTRPSRRTLWTIARAAWRARGGLLPVGRLAVQPAQAMISERFAHPAIASLLLNLAASGGIPVDAAGSGILATVLALEHDYGVLRPRGGSGKLISALADCVRHHGGEIVVNTPAERILIRDGAAVGVALNGHTLPAKAVLAAIDPVTLATRLVGLDNLPESTRREISGVGQYRANLAMGAIGARLSARPALSGSDAPPMLLGATLYLGPSATGIGDAVRQARGGDIPRDLPVWLILPSVSDPSLAPPGPEQTAYLYLPILPHQLSGSDWTRRRDDLRAAALATVDRHLPGFTDLVVSTFVHTPDDLVRWSHGTTGGPYHVDLSLDQLGPWRPWPSFAGYRTPVRGLYHAGAGAHPLGTLNGWSGRSAARLLLADSG